MRNLWRDKFDASKKFVARREITLGDDELKPGDLVKSKDIPERRLRQLYDQRSICHADVWEGYEEGVDELDELRTEAEKLGIKVDKRWGEDRLKKEISDHGKKPA